MATLDPNVTALCPNLDADAVRELIDTDLTDARIHNYINFAYSITIPLQGKLADCGGTTTLCQIMLLLSAHFMTVYERQSKSESVAGEWSVTYLGQDGLGLEASLYGQQALALDCSGFLRKAQMKKASMAVVGYEDFT